MAAWKYVAIMVILFETDVSVSVHKWSVMNLLHNAFLFAGRWHAIQNPSLRWHNAAVFRSA